ncbi:hypothetical protein IMZ48_28940, partial [Candidatus Bathyarchaeota archaeon]|nr:hypothetical protein [Candidatus Bathyarchaeota archaeon]
MVRELLDMDAVRRFQSGPTAGSGIYADDGHVAVARDQPAPVASGASLGELSVDDQSAPSKSGSSKASDVQESQSITPNTITSAATSIETAPALVTSEDIYKYATGIWAQMKTVFGRDYHPFEYTGPADAENCLFVFGSDTGLFGEAIDGAASDDIFANVGLLTPRLYRPWLGAVVIETLPKSVKRVAVLEQVYRKTTKWGPLLLDILTTLKSGFGGVQTIVGYQLGYITSETVTQALRGVLQNLTSDKPIQNLPVGKPDAVTSPNEYSLETPKVETAYTKILDQLFGQRVYLANALSSKHAGISATISASPEFGFGSLLARKEHRGRFVAEVKDAVKSKAFITEAPTTWLTKWSLNAEDPVKSGELADYPRIGNEDRE